jgi:hypothetical protein
MTQPSYFTWNDGDPDGMAAASAAYMKAAPALVRREGARGDSRAFRNVQQPNTSVRDGFDREDYDLFRPASGCPPATTKSSAPACRPTTASPSSAR